MWVMKHINLIVQSNILYYNPTQHNVDGLAPKYNREVLLHVKRERVRVEKD